MKRYLLMKIGYDTIAVPVETAEQLDTVVSCLFHARCVEPTVHGDSEVWVPTGRNSVQLQIVPASRVTIGDELTTLRAKLEEAQRDRDRLSRWWKEARDESERLKKTLAEQASAVYSAPSDPSGEEIHAEGRSGE